MTFPLTEHAARTVTTATILGLALLASPTASRAVELLPATAVGSPLILAQNAATPMSPAAPATKQLAAAKAAPVDRTEARIKDLHDKLHITPAQSAQWDAVAQAMRSSAAEMKNSMTERSAKAKHMTAMDDLRSYQEVARAHSDGLNKFVPVFASLYDGMSAEQKQNADLVFARAQHRAAPKVSKVN